MKVILSRKGFDSKYGGQPSPILPDGTLLSLPIPLENELITYDKLQHNRKTYYDIIKELKPNTKQIANTTKLHLDPDLRKDIYSDINRNINWKPIYGQSDAGQGHLEKQNVLKDDIFLFFGWFRQTESFNGKLRYTPNSKDQHIIFGYLQIGECFKRGDNFPDYSSSHPHTQENRKNLKNNCIYVAKEKLTFNENFSGAGTFKFDKNLVLTKEGESRSKWELPAFFTDLKISYHNECSFKKDYFQSAMIGQEFVIQSKDELTTWVNRLIVKHSLTQ